jgi:two-component system sensor histidine kinase KdpD
MSRLESGFLQLKMDWCDMNELIHKIIKNNRNNASQHSIVFEVNDKLPLFKTDQFLIDQVLQNILHNALQYTPKNSTIHIDVRQITSGCRLTISDNGRGFPKNSIKSVFDKFYRLPQTATGGTGLGLSIA